MNIQSGPEQRWLNGPDKIMKKTIQVPVGNFKGTCYTPFYMDDHVFKFYSHKDNLCCIVSVMYHCKDSNQKTDNDLKGEMLTTLINNNTITMPVSCDLEENNIKICKGKDVDHLDIYQGQIKQKTVHLKGSNATGAPFFSWYGAFRIPIQDPTHITIEYWSNTQK